MDERHKTETNHPRESFGRCLARTRRQVIERGTESDIDNVLILLRSGRIDLPVLSQYPEEIMARYGAESIKQDPVEYRSKLEILRKMWQTRSPTGRP